MLDKYTQKNQQRARFAAQLSWLSLREQAVKQYNETKKAMTKENISVSESSQMILSQEMRLAVSIAHQPL